MRRAALLPLFAVLAACSGTVGTYPPSPNPATQTAAANWPAPDNRLTPGAVTPGCTYPRPASQRDVTPTTRRAVLAAYHYTGPTDLGHVELDHRVPFSLCGSNGRRNLWPEPYDGARREPYTANFKDKLERVIASRVRYHRMTLAQAQAVFLGDWRVGWCRWVYPDPSNPDVVCPAK
jgi:hypothetical protein